VEVAASFPLFAKVQKRCRIHRLSVWARAKKLFLINYWWKGFQVSALWISDLEWLFHFCVDSRLWTPKIKHIQWKITNEMKIVSAKDSINAIQKYKNFSFLLLLLLLLLVNNFKLKRLLKFEKFSIIHYQLRFRYGNPFRYWKFTLRCLKLEVSSRIIISNDFFNIQSFDSFG